MIKHNLLLIARNIRRFKGTFLINLLGLSSGLTCALLIYLWVYDEISVDRFQRNGDRLYYAWEHRKKADGIWTARTTNGPLAQALASELPEVEMACVTTLSTRPAPSTLSVGETSLRSNGRYADSQFFLLFGYPMAAGDASSVLKDEKAIVISERLAVTLFGSADAALNKMIQLNRQDQFLVTGVFETLPRNSSEQFEFVLPFSYFEAREPWAKEWNSTACATYVLLRPDANVDAVNNKIADFVNIKTNDATKHKTLFLKKYTDIYLYGEYENGVLKGGRITYVKLFSIIAVFIVLIACINFMNLSTARSAQRVREVGVKKAMGAARRTLIVQHLSESVATSFLALMLAILLTDLCIRPFNLITGKSLQLQFNTQLVFVLLAIGVVTGLLAGSYPAMYISGFKPASILRGNLSASAGGLWIRKGLVIFQFALSVVLIVSVMVVYSQIRLLQTMSLGYDRDNVLMFNRQGKLNDYQLVETFLTEARRIPGVLNAAVTSHSMIGHNSGTSGLVWEGKDPQDRTEFENFAVGHGLADVLGMEIIDGRGFDRQSPGDTSKLIINETGVKFMGIKDPVGANVKLWGMDMQIVGIVRDFHYESVHEPNKPLFLRLHPNASLVAVKLDPRQQQEAITGLEALHQRLNPEFAFEFNFLDAQYQSQYIAEQRVSTLSRYFAGLAILISCLGLFGLAAFTTERRTKEIGIRKVMGSSVTGIVYLLTAEFTRIVLMAVLIALPIAYYVSSSWLESFAYRTTLSGWFFALAGALALLIAWLTVSIHAVRAARLNPARCLKEQ